jgi:hypothetical protein
MKFHAMKSPGPRKMAAFSAILPALLAAACAPAATSPEVTGATSAPATTSPEVAGTTSAPATTATATADAPAGSLLGTWMSPSCGERKYARQIDFADGGTFSSADLVSPCPPNARCVWSGIVNRRGTYSVSGGKIALTATGGGPQGKPLPESLGLDPATGAPFETDSTGKTCAYERPAKKP